MSNVQVESTIQDVIGIAPFAGTAGFTLWRVPIKTWLMRQGWNGKVIGTMSPEDMKAVYTDFDRATELALEHNQPAMAIDRGRRFAAAPYVPKDQGVIRMLKRKQARGGFTPISADDAEEDETGISETRVRELIAKHVAALKPQETIIKIATGLSAKDVVEVKGTKHPKLATLAKVMASRMRNGFVPNVWIYGPTASGKTHAAEQIADAMKRKFYMHGAMSMTHELMGYKDAGGRYHTTPFRDCFEKGGVVLLDECDSWDPAVTLALNGALANGLAAFPDGMIRRHRDCIILAAANTTGSGATAEFVGRNRLDAAFMSRFPIKIDWQRDPAIEKALGGNDVWTGRVMAARDRAAAAGIKHAIDPRHTQAGAALLSAGMSMDEAADLTYLAGLNDAQRRTVEGK